MSFEEENSGLETSSRRRRSYSKFFTDSSDEEGNGREDRDFYADPSDDDDDFFLKTSTRHKKRKTENKEQKARNSKAVKFIKKKRKNSSDDNEDDSDDLDFVGKVKANSYAGITSQRQRKLKQDGDFVSSLSIEDLAKSEDISEDEVKKMLDEKKKPQVDEILGVLIDQESGTRKYYVKFQREPLAHAVFLTEDELLEHPSGQTHFTEFQKREQEYGLIDSIDMPGISICQNSGTSSGKSFRK